MTRKPQDEPTCDAENLECICKASNSLANNTEFDQQCVLDHCFGDIGREEFLDSIIYHCDKVQNPLIDIPKRWEPYLPARYTLPNPLATTAATPSPPDKPSSSSSSKFGTGAIIGTALASALVLAILLGLAKLYHDTKKKAHRLKVENAELHDVTNPDGASRRITALMSGASTPSYDSPADDGFARTGDRGGYDGGDTTIVGSPRGPNVYELGPGPYKEYAESEAESGVGGEKCGYGPGESERYELDGRPRVYDDSEMAPQVPPALLPEHAHFGYGSAWRRCNKTGNTSGHVLLARNMLVSILILFVSVAAAAYGRNRDCTGSNDPPTGLPTCTNTCLIRDNEVLDGACADSLSSFCWFSDGIRLHFMIYGPCILDACSQSDRKTFVHMFQEACKKRGDPFLNPKIEGQFNYEDLLEGKTPGSSSLASSTTLDSTSSTVAGAASTRTGGNEPIILSSMDLIIMTDENSTTSPMPSPEPSINTTPTDNPSTPSESSPQPPPPILAPPPPPTDTAAQQQPDPTPDDTTLTTLPQPGTTILPPPTTTPPAAEPPFSTTAIAGTVAGSTAGLALLIGAIYLYLRRRRLRTKTIQASTHNPWDPTPKTEGHTRYAEVGLASKPQQQFSTTAELPVQHRQDIPPAHADPIQTNHGRSPPPPPTAVEPGVYYHQRPTTTHHRSHERSNMDSRYPSHIRSPSPVSDTSTMMANWHVESQFPPLKRGTGAAADQLSLGSPISELGAGLGGGGSGYEGVAELGGGEENNKGGSVGKMEGCRVQKLGGRGGVSTNF
ncbi:hypothetical protein BDW02DRAFT_646054 [Decorospora gaudefroyi]|uniref:Uncharacterized protein n=1 Tax=Decorospora gaudefroyi TaxID=184978 RepID=A0A6A5KS93_9PLEO|nr:hypothetical protein BDW02DRAFT_646054 [Decorospora gaudefroyi]